MLCFIFYFTRILVFSSPFSPASCYCCWPSSRYNTTRTRHDQPHGPPPIRPRSQTEFHLNFIGKKWNPFPICLSVRLFVRPSIRLSVCVCLSDRGDVCVWRRRRRTDGRTVGDGEGKLAIKNETCTSCEHTRNKSHGRCCRLFLSFLFFSRRRSQFHRVPHRIVTIRSTKLATSQLAWLELKLGLGLTMTTTLPPTVGVQINNKKKVHKSC